MSLTSALTPYADQVIPIGVLFEDAVGGAPTPALAAGYNMGLAAFEFVADVDLLTVPFYPDGNLPQITIIDTSTMQIVYKAIAYDEQAILDTVTGL